MRGVERRKIKVLEMKCHEQREVGMRYFKMKYKGVCKSSHRVNMEYCIEMVWDTRR